MENNIPDIYYKKEWRELYSLKDNGIPEEYKLESEFGTIIYPYIKRSILDKENKEVYYDTVTPYGFNGPIIIEHNNKEKLLEEFEKDFKEYCSKNKIIAEYVRFSPWFKNYLDFENFYNLKLNKKTIAIDLTVNNILMDEINGKRRNQIRSAIKKGVKIQFDFDGITIEDFYRLYQNTIEKNHIGEYYWLSKQFLKEHFEKLYGNVFFINAIYENKIISSSMFIHCDKQMHYHFSANDYNYNSLNGNSLILYEAAKWGKDNGKENLHLGGMASEDSLIKFKLSFTKSDGLDYYVGMNVQNQEIYEKLVKQYNGENSNYFPKYRGD